MADAAAADDPADRPLRTLADKVNWLIDRAHPAGRGPYSNAEVSALIEKVTGEELTTPRSGSCATARRPTRRCGSSRRWPARSACPGGFFDDYDDEQAGLLLDQVEALLTLQDAQLRGDQRPVAGPGRADSGGSSGRCRPDRAHSRAERG